MMMIFITIKNMKKISLLWFFIFSKILFAGGTILHELGHVLGAVHEQNRLLKNFHLNIINKYEPISACTLSIRLFLAIFIGNRIAVVQGLQLYFFLFFI